MSAETDSDAGVATGTALAQGSIGPALFQDWLDAIDIVDVEAAFRFADDGVHVGAVNPSRTVQLETTLFPQAFEEYFHAGGATEHERLAFVEDIWKTAGLCDTDAEEDVTIRVDGPSEPLHLRTGPVERTVATYDIEGYQHAADLGLEDAWDYRAAIDRADLEHATKAARIPFFGAIGATDGLVQFHATPFDGELSLVAEGDTDEIERSIDSLDVIQAPEKAIWSAYPRKHLQDVVKTIPDGAVVAFAFGPEAPFELRWTLEEELHGEEQVVAEATYTVAPSNGGVGQ